MSFHGYYKGGAVVTSANFGDTITYDVPGFSPGTIWLEQTVNGNKGYTGPLPVPMSPYTLRQGQDVGGMWISTAYQYVNGQKGPYIESASLFVSPAIVSSQGGGSPSQGGVTPISVSGGGGGGGTSVNISAAIAPSLTPGLPGSVSNPSPTGLQTVYRFVLQTGSTYATGANYAGCSQTNSAMCDPQQFNTLADVLAYAGERNEVPLWVFSADEPWNIIAGTEPVNPANIIHPSSALNMGTLALVGIGAYLLFFRKRSA